MTEKAETYSPHAGEEHTDNASKLNWLRAGVLGANDGIVSVAALLIGVIAAGSSNTTIIMAGIAATVAGAVSMALGEYVSVSTQRDTEKRLIEKESAELRDLPVEEHEELKQIFMGYGINEQTAEQAVNEIEAKDPLPVHLRLELGIDSDELTNPWAAAISSAISFTLGALLPILSVILAPSSIALYVLIIVTLLTLALTGWISAQLSDASKKRAVLRLVIGGALGLLITYFAGSLFGVAGV